MKPVDEIRAHYNQSPETEWKRIENRPEFLISCRFMARYIQKGDRILDIGGGPGRYALHFAKQGCHVTLLDLSEENVRFAATKAQEQGLTITALQGDARQAADILEAEGDKGFDHVFLMGPMYHLLEESDRKLALSQALSLLRPGGKLYVTFITLFAGMIYAMQYEPRLVLYDGEAERNYLSAVLAGKSYGGPAFTTAHFSSLEDARGLFEGYPLKQLHFLSQEGVLSPCERNLACQPPEVYNKWLDISEALCEREEYLSWAEHWLYIGEKEG
jgi:S-adenosylmethionine-dependent methyltransferase